MDAVISLPAAKYLKFWPILCCSFHHYSQFANMIHTSYPESGVGVMNQLDCPSPGHFTPSNHCSTSDNTISWKLPLANLSMLKPFQAAPNIQTHLISVRLFRPPWFLPLSLRKHPQACSSMPSRLHKRSRKNAPQTPNNPSTHARLSAPLRQLYPTVKVLLLYSQTSTFLKQLAYPWVTHGITARKTSVFSAVWGPLEHIRYT